MKEKKYRIRVEYENSAPQVQERQFYVRAIHEENALSFITRYIETTFTSWKYAKILDISEAKE